MLWSHVVAQLVEALRYKPEGRGLDSRWWYCGPGVDWASNRYEYQKYFLGGKGGRCIGLTTLPPLCADCLEVREPQFPEPSVPVQACAGTALPLLKSLISWTKSMSLFDTRLLRTYAKRWNGQVHGRRRRVNFTALRPIFDKLRIRNPRSWWCADLSLNSLVVRNRHWWNDHTEGKTQGLPWEIMQSSGISLRVD